MGEIYIHYGNLDDAVAQSKKARNEIDDYIEEIKKKITKPISKLSGSDTQRYTSTASNLAQKKINALTSKKSELSKFESSVKSLVSTAKDADEKVSKRIGSIADTYIGKRSWIQQRIDAIYDTFCVDLPNSWDWTRAASDQLKKWGTNVSKEIIDVKNWFKHGDGRYVLNCVYAVGTVVLATVATCTAILAIPFTGGTSAAIAVGIIGAAASAIGTAITCANAEAAIESNTKALSLSEEGETGAARYYGSVSSLSQKWAKTDMGDAGTNASYQFFGKAVDTTKTLADITAFTCTFVNAMGAVRDYRCRPENRIKSYGDFSMKNIKHNITGEFGFYITKPGRIKDIKVTWQTLQNVLRGKVFLKEQREKIGDIWASDNGWSEGQANYDDPIGEFETTTGGFGDLLNVWQTANSMG